MRATEIIRDLLDLIDQIDQETQEHSADDVLAIAISNPEIGYDNSPNEYQQDVRSVTVDAGGGWNGPKNPSDLRSDSVSLYPNHQHKPGV
jgi:hypothetical protein